MPVYPLQIARTAVGQIGGRTRVVMLRPPDFSGGRTCSSGFVGVDVLPPASWPAQWGFAVLPLPKQVDDTAALLTIDVHKDVDGFHPLNVGRLACGMDSVVPCTRSAVAALGLAQIDSR